MTQNYKPAYPAEFRQQMVELVALGRYPKQLSKEFGCHYTSIQAEKPCSTKKLIPKI